MSLCSVAQVREYLQLPDTETGQDGLIAALIPRVDQLIQSYTSREFEPTASATRTFRYWGGGTVSVMPYDLRTVTGVSYDIESGSPTVLSSGDWVLRPLNTTNGTYNSIELVDYYTRYPSGSTPVHVSITGAWGFASVPADVEHAAIMAVVAALRNEVGVSSVIGEAGEVRFERPAALPGTVRAILDRYRVIPV